jgi:hypothetical protein
VAFRRSLQMLQFCTAVGSGGGSDLVGRWKAGNRRAWLARMGEKVLAGSH